MGLAVQVVRLVDDLPRRIASRHVAAQMVRSAMGAGANFEEARAAESQADFVHKLAVAAKEARETYYWLRLIDRAKLLKIGATLREAEEVMAILLASHRSAKRKANS